VVKTFRPYHERSASGAFSFKTAVGIRLQEARRIMSSRKLRPLYW
jgi:hypothetical protein